MTGDQVLWAVGFLLLGVVVGVRLGVWWFTKVKVASARIDAGLPALPRSQSPLFDEEGLLR